MNALKPNGTRPLVRSGTGDPIAKPVTVGTVLVAHDGTRFRVVAIYPEARNRASNVLVRSEVAGTELTISMAKAEGMERGR